VKLVFRAQGVGIVISREDVIWCYRVMFGREPESEHVITQHMQFSNLATMRQAVLRSSEFQALLGQLKLDGEQFVSGALRPSIELSQNKIQLDASQDEMHNIWTHIQRSWEILGDEQPHYSVISSDEFLPDRIAENVDSFWNSGVFDLNFIRHIINRHHFVNSDQKVCTELGCGVGRVSIPLSTIFKRIQAFDISKNHLAMARERALAFGIDTIAFALIDRDALDSLPPSDFIYSRLVLQHNPPPLMELLIRSLLRSLNKGGVAVLQLPTYIIEYEFSVSKYLKNVDTSGIEMHCIPQHRLFHIIRDSECELQELREDSDAGSPEIILSNTAVISRR
jgi:SAM-dependent methyltransferase